MLLDDNEILNQDVVQVFYSYVNTLVLINDKSLQKDFSAKIPF
jgi:hypothetical protein